MCVGCSGLFIHIHVSSHHRCSTVCCHSLFCRNVAHYYPKTLSSIIVRSYHTSSPGELSRKWKSSSRGLLLFPFLASPSSRRIRRFTVSALLYGFLQQIGALSPSFQRVLIHILQPVVLGALFYLGMILSEHPLSFIGVGVICLGLVIYIVNTIRRDLLQENAESLPHQGVIVPEIVPDQEKDNESVVPAPSEDDNGLHSPSPSLNSRKERTKKNQNNENKCSDESLSEEATPRSRRPSLDHGSLSGRESSDHSEDFRQNFRVVDEEQSQSLEGLNSESMADPQLEDSSQYESSLDDVCVVFSQESSSYGSSI